MLYRRTVVNRLDAAKARGIAENSTEPLLASVSAERGSRTAGWAVPIWTPDTGHGCLLWRQQSQTSSRRCFHHPRRRDERPLRGTGDPIQVSRSPGSARMFAIREGIDDGHDGVLRHGFDVGVQEHSSDDGVDVAAQDPRRVGHAFALAELDFGRENTGRGRRAAAWATSKDTRVRRDALEDEGRRLACKQGGGSPRARCASARELVRRPGSRRPSDRRREDMPNVLRGKGSRGLRRARRTGERREYTRAPRSTPT